MGRLLLDKSLLIQLKKIVSFLLPKFDDTDITPKFGNGSTAEKHLDPSDKF
jgi:hypothetical protein